MIEEKSEILQKISREEVIELACREKEQGGSAEILRKLRLVTNVKGGKENLDSDW